MKILVATDGSSCSTAAVNEVARRPWPPNSEVRIVSVVELLFVTTPENYFVPESYYRHLLQKLQEHARDAIDKAAALLQESDQTRMTPLEITSEIINGNPKVVLLDEAEQWGAD